MKRLLCLLMLCTLLGGCASVQAANTDFTSVPTTDAAASAPQATPTPSPASSDYRAVWISYLELQELKGLTEADFRTQVDAMLQNCVALGLNTVILQVRPFSDALYQSELFPQSHILAAAQGQAIGYDPLQIFIEQGHALGLQVEAWINPYRIQLSSSQPAQLSANNPAVLHPEWTKSANGGLYYDPSLPQVRQLVVDGVTEIVSRYDVDGIHFDDYFYPTTEQAFDAEQYAASGSQLSLADWRRDNVNQLVAQVYEAIKAIDPTVRFGISPQGNNANNYDQQYSDVCLWLSQPGYVDYILPQLYWGFDYLTASGRTDYQFAGLCEQWAAYPRCDEVQLYIGLGAWRIGDGDGGSNDQAEWSSGTNLAKMVQTLRDAGCSGFALYRYGSLYTSAYPSLAASEVQAMAGLLVQK